MRKMLDGSKMARGRKKRRNIRKSTARKEKTLAQTMRRRSLLTGGSGALSTSGPAGRAGVGLAAAAFVTPLFTAGVGVEVAFEAPEEGETRAAAGVAAGTSFDAPSPGDAASATVPEEASFADGGTTVFSFAGAGSRPTTSPLAAASRSLTFGLPPCSSFGVPGALSAGGVGLSV